MKAVGYLKSPVPEEECESAVLRCLHDAGVKEASKPRDGLTLFEAKQWLRSMASRSPYLSVR